MLNGVLSTYPVNYLELVHPLSCRGQAFTAGDRSGIFLPLQLTGETCVVYAMLWKTLSSRVAELLKAWKEEQEEEKRRHAQERAEDRGMKNSLEGLQREGHVELK